MEDSSTPISSRPEDNVPLPLDQLSRYARVSRAFLRLCMDSGCPAPGGKFSQATMIEWLSLNYATVRATAGLRALAPVDGLHASAQRTLQLANTMITLLEYSESRATNPAEKQQLRSVLEMVERSI